ncbi:MAG: hypothetical protein D6678_06005 [Zetaproteobacteria bacterium]|nr:MAG: hypothetical protein D6678_06005 [Zetaproteobacteria bacterium]
MRPLLIIPLALMAATSAMAAPFGLTGKSIEERAAELDAQVKGKTDYHAHLARELAMAASAEKAQHDTKVAQALMSLAEREAAKSGRQ